MNDWPLHSFPMKEILVPRTGTPRQLRAMEPVTMSAAYDPPDVAALMKELIPEPQDVTVWIPWILMSGVGQLWKLHSRFKGHVYLAKCEPVGMKEGELPEATVTIVPEEAK